MITYISMLRGINVSGQKIIKMGELVSLYESLGLVNVRTYVQSGNVLFESPIPDVAKISRQIAGRIKKTFGFSVVVLIRTGTELREIIANNPFLEDPQIDPGKLYVTFLSEPPPEAGLNQLQTVKDKTDKIKVGTKEVYLYCPHGYGRTKYSNNFLEKTLKVSGTTRNWNTVNRLLAMTPQ